MNCLNWITDKLNEKNKEAHQRIISSKEIDPKDVRIWVMTNKSKNEVIGFILGSGIIILCLTLVILKAAYG